jgi:parvulin-like peptidyl-prolyl isomerase
MRRLVPLLALVALVAACGSSHGVTVPKGAVAQAGDVTITKAQLDDTLAAAKAFYRTKKRPFPARGTPAYRKLRDRSIDSLVQAAIFDQEATKLGVAVTSDDVDRDIADLRQQAFGGSDSELRISLRQQGLTYALFRAQERRQLVEDAITAKVESQATVSDAKARAYYRAHRSDYRTPPSRDVRQLLVKQKALADSIYRQLKAGASFSKLVERYTIDTASKQTGGEVTDTKGLFVAPFERVAFSLATNEISRPVRTQYGWHVIQALGPVQPPTIRPYAQVAPSIKTVLSGSAQNEALKRFTRRTYAAWCADKLAYGKGYATSFCATYRTTPRP